MSSRGRRRSVPSGVREAEGDAKAGAEARPDDETADAKDGPGEVEGKKKQSLDRHQSHPPAYIHFHSKKSNLQPHLKEHVVELLVFVQNTYCIERKLWVETYTGPHFKADSSTW